MNQTFYDREGVYPVILGAGLTGLAISRALSAAEMTHVLVGDRPTETPRLGESLNADGSLEIMRQFPDLARFCFDKHRVALFFGGHALSFDSLQYAAGHAYYRLLGYPSTVQLRHVDRVSFDRALFETAIASKHCIHISDRVIALDYKPASDHIAAVILASGKTIAATYVFDATNQACFVARKLGVQVQQIGETRRVVFAHYRAANGAATPPPPWMDATSLLRLDSQEDPVEGLAWCIPLGDYVSVGISIDPERSGASAALLLDWVEQAYAARGMDVHAAFPNRSLPVDHQYVHYNHERCYGRNWLLAGSSCCQFWFPSASGVATGLIAARLAPDVLKSPTETPLLYQAYIDQAATSHAGLDWLVRDDPWSVTFDEVERRSQAMVVGNVKRLGGYLGLHDGPPELMFGDALWRLYEGDRFLANPVQIDSALPKAQGTRLFATANEPNPWQNEMIDVPVLTRPSNLQGPQAILGLVDVLSGRRDVASSTELVRPDVQLQIDHFQLQGSEQWHAWVTF
ncbi:MAG: hypothetical protein KF751_21965, partial [Nitrospira sp.]|nr:hypothetical protein [Nitrospira sp.]